MTPLFKLFSMLVLAFATFSIAVAGYWAAAIPIGLLAWLLAGMLVADLAFGLKDTESND